MSEEKAKWTKVGELLKAKGGSLYIKFKDNCSFKAEDSLQLQDPRTSIKKLMKNGIIEEDEGEKKLASLAEREWYKYDVFVVK
jgi:hypothetical protein